MVCFGSNKILRVPAGADRLNEDSVPSANTRPMNTEALPDTTAYRGTDVTKSSVPFFCKIVPLTMVAFPFGVNLTNSNCSLGRAVPLIQPSKNQSSDALPS